MGLRYACIRLRFQHMSDAETLGFVVRNWSARKISLVESILPEIFIFCAAISEAVDTIAENPAPDQRYHFQFFCHSTVVVEPGWKLRVARGEPSASSLPGPR